MGAALFSVFFAVAFLAERGPWSVWASAVAACGPQSAGSVVGGTWGYLSLVWDLRRLKRLNQCPLHCRIDS